LLLEAKVTVIVTCVSPTSGHGPPTRRKPAERWAEARAVAGMFT
jgi:hypothetical protein